MAIIDVTAPPHNAAGNGSSNDTSAIQGAINAAAEGDVVFMPRGTYEVDTLDVPFNKSLTFLGESPQASVLRTRTNDIDLFVSDRGTGVAEDRFTTQHHYWNFRCVMRTSGADTAATRDRCTASGVPIGVGTIVYERQSLHNNPAAGNDDAWTSTFGSIRNMIFEDNDTGGGSGVGSNSVAVYFSGTPYGWKIDNIKLHDIQHAIVVTAPFIRRVSIDTGSNILSHSGGTYPANAPLFLLNHSNYGSIASGVSRYTDVFARDSSNGQLRLSTSAGGGAVNFSSAGSAPNYVAARDSYTNVLSPDQMRITDITVYGARSGISIANPEGTLISGVWVYLSTTNIIDIRDYSAGSRDRPLSTVVENVYCEAPQTGTLPASSNQARDPFVYVSGRGMTVSNVQIRGETAGVTRPRFEVACDGSHVSGIYCLSNASQAQPDVVITGNGNFVQGLLHASATVTNSGANNKVFFTDEAGNVETASNF